MILIKFKERLCIFVKHNLLSFQFNRPHKPYVSKHNNTVNMFAKLTPWTQFGMYLSRLSSRLSRFPNFHSYPPVPAELTSPRHTSGRLAQEDLRLFMRGTRRMLQKFDILHLSLSLSLPSTSIVLPVLSFAKVKRG